MGGISIWQLLIILLIVVLVFGSKKLKGLGKDLGGAVQGFKNEMGDKEKKGDAVDEKTNAVEEKTKSELGQQKKVSEDADFTKSNQQDKSKVE